MSSILVNSDKEKLREVVSRMIAGEPSLHTKTIGNIKLVRTSEIPEALLELHKRDVALGKYKFLKRFKGVDFYERRAIPPR